MKILLINPPSAFKTPILPLGLASLAAYLKEKGGNREIAVIDAWAENISGDELGKKVAETEADIVGIYVVSPRYEKAKETIAICRRSLPGALIVAGGPHPSAVPQETLQDIPDLDVCIIGEGEATMQEITTGKALSDINGIAYRKNENIVLNQPREFIKNLDELPYPARDIFPLKKYRTHPPYGRKNPYFTIITSRGCPFQCAYCSKDVFQQNYRAMSPQRIVDEIKMLVKNYGAKEIHFYDDDFTVDMARGEAICDEILRRNLKIIWSCNTRVDLVNEKLLKKMKQAGCWLISYGVESGDEQILKSINKGFSVSQVIAAFEITRQIGIKTLAYFMVGLPGETKETVQKTIALSKKIKPDFVSFGSLVVYPGSRLFKLIQNGRYPGKLRTLGGKEKIAGTFFGGKGNYVVLEDNLTFEELQEIIKKANRGFYLNPSYVLRSIASIKSWSDLNYYFKAGIELLKSIVK